MSDRVLSVNIPTVGFKGADDTDASAFERAAKNLEAGYSLGGGNLTGAVARLLRNAATALRASGQPDPESSYYDHQRALRESKCKGFQWVGQEWSSCDGCGQPYWEHTHMEGLDPDASPFDSDGFIYVPISDESRQQVKARYAKSLTQ